MAGPVYATEGAQARIATPLDGLCLIYHRPSGQTHLLAEPAPQIARTLDADVEVGKVLGYANSLAATVSTAIALISNPSALSWKVMGALGLSGLATTVAAWSAIVRSISRVGASSLSDPAAPLVYTPSRQQAFVNACAVNALGRQALIAQAVASRSKNED